MDKKTLTKLTAPFKNHEIVTIWTIQTQKVWEAFQKSGMIIADGKRAMNRQAYQWMKEQMKKRLPIYSGKFPIWAWYYPKPDLRQIGLGESGTNSVKIECRVATARLLLSDFDTWHCVLNDWYLPLNEKDRELWNLHEEKYKPLFWQMLKENWDPNGSRSLRLKKIAEQNTKKGRESWQRIFDLKAINSSRVFGGIDRIQATIEKIYLSEVIKITEFICR